MTHSSAKTLSRGKRILFTFITLTLMWLIVDGAAFILMKQRPYLFFDVRPPTQEAIDSFHDSLWDARWGWNLSPKENRARLGNRKGREYEVKDLYTIKTFGDSFTQGAVENNQTFQYLIEEATGWECLNFGVGAYGTDQALLKYQGTDVPTRYTILGILDENIGRIVMNSWMYYVHKGFWPKPRFILDADGKATLVPNPATTIADLHRMKDEDFLHSLRANNYWYTYRQQSSILDPLIWPATPILARNAGNLARSFMKKFQRPEGWRESYEFHLEDLAHYHLYEQGSEGLRLMRYVVNEFVATAHERGEIPIVVIFPELNTMSIISRFDRKPYQSLVDHLRASGVSFIDFGDVFEREGFEQYYDGGNVHFGPVGNQRVADEIVRLVRKLDGRG